MNLLELRQHLKNICEKEGSVRAWATKKKISFSYVSSVIRGDAEPGKKILKAMGIGRCFVPFSGKYEPTPGVVYRHWGKDGELLYIGSSKRVDRRTMQHKHTTVWWNEIKDITIENYACLQEARQAEKQAIKKEKPKYNKLKSN